MLPQIPHAIVRYKTNDKYYDSIQEAAISCKNVTLNKSYVPRNWKTHRAIFDHPLCNQEDIINKVNNFSQPTMFEEIEAVFPPLHTDVLELLKVVPTQDKTDIKALTRKVHDRIVDYILKYWDSSKIHCMPHSSGHDSRIISNMIRKLNLPGEIHFICVEPEVNVARNIVDYIGWPKDSFIGLTGGPVDYFADVMDFSYLGANWSEVSRMVIGEFKVLKAINEIAPADQIHTISGSRLDEVFGSDWNAGSLLFNSFTGSMSAKSKWDEVIIPVVSVSVLREVFKYKKMGAKKVKPILQKMVNPGLEQFKNVTSRYREYDRISKSFIRYITKSVQNSWYAKTFKKIPIPIKGTRIIQAHTDLMKDYVKAAICEHIVKHGCIIKI